MFLLYLSHESYARLSDGGHAESEHREVALCHRVGREIEEIHPQEVPGTSRNGTGGVRWHLANIKANGEGARVCSLR